MMSSMRRTTLSLLATVAVVFAGCSSDKKSASDDPATTTTAAGTTATGENGGVTTTPAATADGAAVLAKVTLKTADVPAGFTVDLMEDGDKVTNQVTLDLCEYNFTSEQQRTARLQNVAGKGEDVGLFSNENVVYRNAAAARGALEELRAAIAQCPQDKFLKSNIQGVPPLKSTLVIVPDGQLGSLATDHVAFTQTTTSEDGESETFVVIFQRRGRVLAAVYGDTVPPLLPYARILAERLSALSPAEAGE